MRVSTVLAVALVTASCGSDSPTAPGSRATNTPPAPPINASGPWSGQLVLVLNGRSGTVPVTAAVTQLGLEFSATLTTTADLNGTLSGTLDRGTAPAALIATLTIDIPSSTPPARCSASGPLSGTVTGTTITGTAARLVPLNCQGTLTDVQLTLSRP
jgi:hypothetical protein